MRETAVWSTWRVPRDRTVLSALAHRPLVTRFLVGRTAPAALLAGVVLLGTLLAGALSVGATSTPPALVVGVLAALLCAWAAADRAAILLPATAAGPAAAVRAHLQALARRAVPRQRDPDAPGHTRSRAPSAHHPAG